MHMLIVEIIAENMGTVKGMVGIRRILHGL